MGRLSDTYGSIIDFIIRQKFAHLLNQINKLDLEQDKIKQLNSLIMEAQAADPDEDGEIQLNTNTVTGLKVMLNAVVYTFLFKEHWYELYGHMQPEIYPDSAGTNFPVFRRINNAEKLAAAFPQTADAGWAASWQLSKVLGAYNIGLVIEWHAANSTGASKGVVFTCTGRIVAVGEDVDSGGTAFSESVTVTVDDGKAEEELQVSYLPLLVNANLADDDLIIVEAFFRDVSAGADTLDDEILISGWKPYWTDRDVSPVE